MLTGDELIRDIDAYEATDAEFGLWWLGQHGFVVKLRSATVYVDPYLSDNPARQTPPLLRPDEVTNADLILGTHDHGDHIDRGAWPVLAARSPNARFVVPELLRETLWRELHMPPERFAGLDDGRSIDVHGLRITGVAAAHEFLDAEATTGLHPYLGYVIEADGCAIYHAGDTCAYEGLQTKLRKWRFDLMMLPINGRDAARLSAGCIGNMTYQEAADLAGPLRPGLTVPAHYDMFAGNGEDPRLFIDYMRVKYPHLAVRRCQHGRRVVVGCRGLAP